MMIPEFPPRIAKLPRWRHMGQLFPVPFFVAWLKDGERCHAGEGEPEFRIADSQKWSACVRKRLCWVCGEKLGTHMAFPIGPMCSINRVTTEPPAHLECAEFSACACPFLTRPRMRRNEKDMPDHQAPGGHMIPRNPGVTCIWVTKSYKLFRDENGAPLMQIGDPVSVSWFAEGRNATRAEVMASIDSGYPALLDLAQLDGDEAVAYLAVQREKAMAYLPANDLAQVVT
jgi:hypothetical protein